MENDKDSIAIQAYIASEMDRERVRKILVSIAPYVTLSHKTSCQFWDRNYSIERCTCGLKDALKESWIREFRLEDVVKAISEIL